MITPDDKLPVNDSDESEADDQQSQKDLHSNGLDDFAETSDTVEDTDPASLQQAYDAAEPSYTLHLDDDGDHMDED